MALTILATVIAPNSVWESGVTGKQRRRNLRAQAGGGAKMINIGWSNTERYYDFGTVPQSLTVWQTLEGLHEVTEGGAYGFLVQDPKDNEATTATGKATLISAGAHTYQAIKRYTSVGSSSTKDRTIKRLHAASFKLYISDVLKTLTADYTFNANTGVITIPSDPAASSVTWSGMFYVPVHFEQDVIDWDLVIAGPATGRRVQAKVSLCEVKE